MRSILLSRLRFWRVLLRLARSRSSRRQESHRRQGPVLARSQFQWPSWGCRWLRDRALEGVLVVSDRALSPAAVTALETVADEMTLGIARLRLIANLNAARKAASQPIGPRASSSPT